MRLTDAHCHLQAPELKPHLESLWEKLSGLNIGRLVCNGMSENDWPEVAAMAKSHPAVIPSFGLHPWLVAGRSDQWEETLLQFLDAHPGCGVGEFGLDKWIKNSDWDAQMSVFRTQLRISAERNLPASIHCVQAWGPMWDEVRQSPVPARGFLIHAYSGPQEMVAGFVKRGAYFSFSPWFMHETKAARREVFKSIPIDRVLIETDAPALWPPLEKNRFPLTNPNTGESVNHPANLQVSLEGLAEVRGMQVEDLADQLEQNFQRWFLC